MHYFYTVLLMKSLCSKKQHAADLQLSWACHFEGPEVAPGLISCGEFQAFYTADITSLTGITCTYLCKFEMI